MIRLFSKIILTIIVLIAVFDIFCSASNAEIHLSRFENDEFWHILDIITPTVGKIEWREEGIQNKPSSRLAGGGWYWAFCHHYLVKSDYVLAFFFESFNWTTVNADLAARAHEGWPSYSSFDDFRDGVTNDPSWWIKYSWQVDINWLGIPLNKTKVEVNFNADTSRANINTWIHITNIPAYLQFQARKRLTPLFTGFDFSTIYIGNLEELQWHERYRSDYTYYNVYFKAPASVLSQHDSTYIFSLDINFMYVNQTSDVERQIMIYMPPSAEVKSTSPSNISTHIGNKANFTLNEGARYPESFSVTSGPPVKDVAQIFLENIGRWLTEPSTWLAFGTLIALVYAAFRGRQIWSRRKTYYRLYKTMVNIYDHYSRDFKKFRNETENLSKSITKYFIEDKITDDQFDKLLTRRDDLTERAKKLQEKD